METSSVVLIIFLSVCSCWISCQGRIQLCTNNLANFENGTAVPAVRGRPVSVVFCVQSDKAIYYYIYLKHAGYRDGYYPDNNNVETIVINVTTTTNRRQATFNITIVSVKDTDFYSNFTITVYNVDGLRRPLQDPTNIVFQLIKSDAVPEQKVSTRATTHPDGAVCRPVKTSACPDKSYLVGGTDTCLLVVDSESNSKAKSVCEKYTFQKLSLQDTRKLRDCVKEILEKTRNPPINYVIRVSENTYMDIRHGTMIHPQNNSSLVCFIKTSNDVSLEISTRAIITSEMPTSTSTVTPVTSSPEITTTTSTVTPVTSSLEMPTITSTVTSVTSKPEITAVTSTTTMISSFPQRLSSSSPTTIVPATPVTSPPETPTCHPLTTSACPDKWYQVGTGACMLVVTGVNSLRTQYECPKHGALALSQEDIHNLGACVTWILQRARSSHYVVRIDNWDYIDFGSRKKVGGQSSYNIVCISRTFKPPVISLFSLQEWNGTTWIPNDNSTQNVTVNTSFGDTIFTCLAGGNPAPKVTITHEANPHTQITSGHLIRLNKCEQTGEYTCRVSNNLGSFQASKTIQFLDPTMEFSLPQQTQKLSLGSQLAITCSIKGCPKRITLTKNGHPLVETTALPNYLVYKIERANCSYMGIYTCLSTFQSGDQVQKTSSLEVLRCPVAPCEGQVTSHNMTASRTENVTFSVCLVSSERLQRADNTTNINVQLNRNTSNSFYWTANITMYNVQETDYKTHTISIKNNHGTLTYTFTLSPAEVHSQGPGLNVSALVGGIIAGFLFIVIIVLIFIILKLKGIVGNSKGHGEARTQLSSPSEGDKTDVIKTKEFGHVNIQLNHLSDSYETVSMAHTAGKPKGKVSDYQKDSSTFEYENWIPNVYEEIQVYENT